MGSLHYWGGGEGREEELVGLQRWGCMIRAGVRGLKIVQSRLEGGISIAARLG